MRKIKQIENICTFTLFFIVLFKLNTYNLN